MHRGIAQEVLMSAVAEARTRDLWLHSAKFDLTFLIGSALLAAVPLTLFYGFGVSTTAINYLVAAVVGGPHLYSTYGMTFMDGNFRRNRSEEHTSELQSLRHLVCRLLL